MKRNQSWGAVLRFLVFFGVIFLFSTSVFCERRPLNDDEIAKNKGAVERFETFVSSLDASNEEADVNAINAFVRKYHPLISSADARAISVELVSQSREHKLDPKFMAAIISAESGFNKKAQSPSGAKGLGQLMGSTYRLFNVTNPFDISENIKATIKYTKNLMQMWEGHSLQLSYALAAYLRGEVAVQRSGGHFTPFTINYIQAVLKRYKTICDLSEKPAPSI